MTGGGRSRRRCGAMGFAGCDTGKQAGSRQARMGSYRSALSGGRGRERPAFLSMPFSSFVQAAPST
eukprot:154887-Karenia_brevis.AAC.1